MDTKKTELQKFPSPVREFHCSCGQKHSIKYHDCWSESLRLLGPLVYRFYLCDADNEYASGLSDRLDIAYHLVHRS